MNQRRSAGKMAAFTSIAIVFISACQKPGYRANDLELVTAYRAKEVCSCIFVMEQDEAFCRRYTAEEPDVATFSVDHEQKRVRTTAFFLWGASARFVGDRFGCVLD
ncbi:MAG: hypothetical protein ACFB9M_05550 [Myxococcota bacterium]